jgi:hypothetical protein
MPGARTGSRISLSIPHIGNLIGPHRDGLAKRLSCATSTVKVANPTVDPISPTG